MSDNPKDNGSPPQGVLCHMVPDDAFSVGVTPEVEDKVIFEFVGDDGVKFAFAFSLEAAYRIHDGVVAAIHMLEPDEDEDFDWDEDGDVTVH